MVHTRRRTQQFNRFRPARSPNSPTSCMRRWIVLGFGAYLAIGSKEVKAVLTSSLA